MKEKNDSMNKILKEMENNVVELKNINNQIDQNFNLNNNNNQNKNKNRN